MEFICYSKCSTCRKAKNWLENQGILYKERDIKEDHPSKEEIKDFYNKSGLPLKKFFNTSGKLYREMGLKDKLKTMSEDEMMDLLASDGMLVKRPIATAGDHVLVGFKEDQWKEIFS